MKSLKALALMSLAVVMSLSFISCGVSDVGNVSGMVTDASTGTAISDVKVEVGSKVTYTNNSGIYTVEHIAVGSRPVAATKTGYQTYSGTVKVQKGNTVTHNIGMTPEVTPTGPTPDVTAPTTPMNLTAIAVSSSQIDLSWTASTDDVGVMGYNIYDGTGRLIGTSTTTSYSHTGLSASTGYCYQVSAVDAAGNESIKSSPVCTNTLATPDTTAPSIPTGLTATAASSSQINLSWTASRDNVGVTRYKVYRGGVYLKSVTATSTSDTGLSASTGYCYTVSAVDAAGNESIKSSPVCTNTLATPDTIAPTAPTGLVANAVSTTQIDLAWMASTDNVGVTGYNIYRDGALINSTSVLTYSDTGLSASTTYCYTVSAYDAAGNESAKSSAVCETSMAIAMFKIPDTGQTQSKSSTFGEDHDYAINPPSYTDNGDNTVTDNITGLMWQKCTVGQNNDASCSGTAATYNWYQASGVYDATSNPSSTDICGALNLGGHSDWRLPTKKELLRIVNYGINYWSGIPMINTSYFPNTMRGVATNHYWTSNTSAGSSDNAWSTEFALGYNYGYTPKTAANHVRCVRGQSPAQSFTDNGNGTITDNLTGLMWQKEDDNTTKTKEQALSYCEGLIFAGYTDWRLPNITELDSITDESIYDPAINTLYFPNTNSSSYWSSTLYLPDTPPDFCISFNIGGRVNTCTTTGGYYVRCVRGQ